MHNNRPKVNGNPLKIPKASQKFYLALPLGTALNIWLKRMRLSVVSILLTLIRLVCLKHWLLTINMSLTLEILSTHLWAQKEVGLYCPSILMWNVYLYGCISGGASPLFMAGHGQVISRVSKDKVQKKLNSNYYCHSWLSGQQPGQRYFCEVICLLLCIWGLLS